MGLAEVGGDAEPGPPVSAACRSGDTAEVGGGTVPEPRVCAARRDGDCVGSAEVVEDGTPIPGAPELATCRGCDTVGFIVAGRGAELEVKAALTAAGLAGVIDTPLAGLDDAELGIADINTPNSL